MRLAILALLCASASWALEPTAVSLVGVRHIYIESLGASPEAIMLRDMVISSLASSGLVVITENADHADAILRGSANEEVFNEQHHSSDNLNMGLHSGNSSGYSSKYDHTQNSKQSGLNIGENENSQSNERRHEAAVAVRLINRDGDVIWSTTQESGGAKFKSASADVADKIYRKLAEDLARARSTASAAMQAGIPTR